MKDGHEFARGGPNYEFMGEVAGLEPKIPVEKQVTHHEPAEEIKTGERPPAVWNTSATCAM